ncbi:5853_t:CDS:2 [Ambispora gerdemannii]|uniref:RNA helicase n=1 Tax=Ambispora gerdemannii TaxID=144530 RepID=A0A9N9H580_9GLOM|nr:5853_t:CDS:2 [Ambispora gerdemannii]
MTGFEVGSLIDCSLFQEGEKVKITGVSKGKGTAGVIKKYHFSRGRMTHGGGYPHRLIGSMGGGRGSNQGIPKGKKMPGRMGGKKTTQPAIVEKIDQASQIIFLRGAVPEKTKKNLLQTGYSQLTDIQLQVIPSALAGKDMVAQSRTGTGKTAAFLIPVCEKIEATAQLQVLILVPTRELSLQVSEEAKKLSAHKNLRVLAVYGGDPIRKQLSFLRRGADIIVGTPGRIIDHIFTQKSLRLDHLKFVVLDEVDEMISKGFLKDIEKIIKKTPEQRQTLLFSATIPPQVGNFAQRFCHNPDYITSEQQEKGAINNIQHYYIETTSTQKSHILTNFLQLNKPKSTIVFANTKRKVEQIKENLSQKNLLADYIHSGLSQARRLRVFDRFKKKQMPLLVATDVAARGLDVKDINYVVNYDFPQTQDFYIHRVGRTGRAGASGKAITFVNSPKEKGQLLSLGRQREFKVEKFINP